MEIASDFARIALFLGIVIFLLLGIVLPISAYSAQKWAYRCYKEMATVTELLRVIARNTTSEASAPEKETSPSP